MSLFYVRLPESEEKKRGGKKKTQVAQLVVLVNEIKSGVASEGENAFHECATRDFNRSL